MTQPSAELARCLDPGTTNNGTLEALLTRNNRKQSIVSRQASLPSCSVGSLWIHGILLLLASAFFALWINAIWTPCHPDSLTTYSPVNEAVQYIERLFDGHLNSTSIFRGYPSPEIDAAWARISVNAKATRLTREQFLMIGGNDSTAAVKYRPEDGGGYMSQIDTYHHIHCLDVLRKYIRRDYYAPFDQLFNNKLRPHLGHCIDLIRQKLMCTSDLTMISYDWIHGLDDPQPNLNARHQCVDYERILDWSDRHNAHVLKTHVVRFGDATDLPGEPM